MGLGYIGLSLLEAFGKAGFPLIGYDIDHLRVQSLKKKRSYLNYMPLKTLFALADQKKFVATHDPSELKKADVIIISVATSLDKHHMPNLAPLKQAFAEVAKQLTKGKLVILQSTTYPGTTEEELLPLLQKRRLKVGKDFFLAYVPEISDIGNQKYSFTDVPRIVSGVTESCQKHAAKLYAAIGCKIVKASSTRIAESAKLLQNTYRLVNISLINEMKIMFDRMGIDIWQVIEAASSKPFGFSAFYPSPGAGGDCIPTDPFYLLWKTKETDGPTSLIEMAEAINSQIPHYVVEKVLEGLNHKKRDVQGAKILVLGVGYKKDVNDTRQAPALKILSLLKGMGAKVAYNDPFVKKLPELKLKSEGKPYSHYDCIVIVTDHSTYDWKKIVKEGKLIIDTRNVLDTLPGAKKKVIKA